MKDSSLSSKLLSLEESSSMLVLSFDDLKFCWFVCVLMKIVAGESSNARQFESYFLKVEKSFQS